MISERDDRRFVARSRVESACLVKLAVIRQKLLRDEPEKLAAGDRRRTVVKPAPDRQRQPDDDELLVVGSRLDDSAKLSPGCLQQRLLQEQVFAGVAGQTEFGE